MKLAVYFILLFLVALVSTYSGASDPPQDSVLPIVINEKNHLNINLTSFALYTKIDDNIQNKSVKITNMPFNKAIRLTKIVKHTDATEIQFSAKTKSPLKQGDLLMLNFYFRKVQQNQQPEQSQLITMFEQSDSLWTNSLNVGVTLSSAWQKYSFTIRVKSPSNSNRDGSYRLAFRLGFDKQTIELANIKLINLPNDLNESDISRTRLSYAGEESDAVWRQKAQQRINDIRKTPMAKTVLDKMAMLLIMRRLTST
jgi:hypothetical protein